MDKLQMNLDYSERSVPYSGTKSDYSAYNCQYCLYGTNAIEALRKHERAHVVPGPPARKDSRPLYSCEFCNSKFVQKKELDDHRKSHAVGTVCSLCNYKSPNKNALRNHVRSHGDKKSFQCLLCCERLTNRKMFDDHLNKHVLTLSSCRWCRFTTDTPSRLKAHFQLHMKTKQIVCKSCGYFCYHETDMKEHRTLHEDAVDVITNETFSKNSVVKPGEEIKCRQMKSLKESQCNEISQTLRVPFESIYFKRLLKRAFFKCSICGEILKSNEALQVHSYKHLATRRYTCHLCPFSGNNSEEIRNHLMEHLPTVEMSEPGK